MKKLKLLSASWCCKCRTVHKTIEGMNLPPGQIVEMSVEDLGEEELKKLGISSIPALMDEDGHIHVLSSGSRAEIQKILDG